MKSAIAKSRFLFILLLSLSSVYCQTSDVYHNFWVNCGAGFYGSDIFSGLTLNSSLNYSRSKLINTNDRTRCKNTNLEFRLSVNVGSLDEDNNEVLTELGLLFGKSFGKALQLKIAGGLGILTGMKTAGYNPPGTPIYGTERILTPGIPLELGISLIPIKYFGIGLTGFGNINTKAPLYGFIINLELGKLYTDKQTPRLKSASVLPDYKTSLGLRGAIPYSYGMTIKHFLKGNKAVEGIISKHHPWGEYDLYCLSVLFENEYKIGSNTGFNWFWGAGMHVGYGLEDKDIYFNGTRERYIVAGLDGILGIEYTFIETPVNLSLDVIPRMDLFFSPWISAGISVRYVF